MEKRKRYLLTVLWLAGMLLSVRGLLASDISLLAAILVGAAVSGARLASGSVLSSKTMWPGVCVLLLAVVKTFLYYSVPDRKPGRYNVGSTVLALVILAGIFWLTGGYQRMAALENWKQGVKDGVEEFRYGRDTLPKGNLSKAAVCSMAKRSGCRSIWIPHRNCILVDLSGERIPEPPGSRWMRVPIRANTRVCCSGLRRKIFRRCLSMTGMKN